MTEKLYYKDAYLKEFDGKVIRSWQDGDGTFAVLDRTAFYPEGGGQGADRGVFRLEDSEISVTDVQEVSDEIVHRTSELLPEGSIVHGIIDWSFRFDHMQQHSGEHIVSGMICSRWNCNNVGFHMGEDVITIDYDARITYEEALEIEDAANAYIWENHAFVQMWPSAQELGKMSYRSKKALEGAVRITSFPGADMCACCGTHVSYSAEVGLVKFLSAKNFHEGTRLELLCGKRAMDFLSLNYRENKKIAVALSTREEKTSDVVSKQLDEFNTLKGNFASMEENYFRLWAESFRGQENVLVIDEHIDAEQGRKLADMIADCCSGIAAVMVKSGNAYRYALISRGKDINGFVRDMNAALNGRGGGRGGFAQGSVLAEKEAIRNYFKGI